MVAKMPTVAKVTLVRSMSRDDGALMEWFWLGKNGHWERSSIFLNEIASPVEKEPPNQVCRQGFLGA
jgi:hypothetical protein